MLIYISCSGKNKQGSILSEVTGSEAANWPVAGSCKMNELESDVDVLSLQHGIKSVEHVSKKVATLLLALSYADKHLLSSLFGVSLTFSF